MPSSVVSFSTPISKHNTDNLAISSTLDELLVCVPRPFQVFYKEHFKAWFDRGVKISHCQHALGQLDNYKTSHTFPPSIMGGIKVPVVQVSKEFQESSIWSAWNQEMTSNITSLRGTALEKCIAIKISEGQYLESLVSDEAAERLNNSVVEKSGRVFSSTFSTSSETSSFYKDEYRMCKTLGKTWFRRAFALGLAKHQKELHVRMSKLSLRKDTDTHMRDYGVNDIQSIVEQAVAKALGKPSKNKNKTSPPKSKTCTCTQIQVFTNPMIRSQENHTSQTKTEQLNRRKRKWEWQEETKEAIKSIDAQALRTKRFKPFDTSSFPSNWFYNQVDIRARWLFLRSTSDFINSISSMQSDVFQGPNVSIPRDINQILSLNGKFVFHEKMKPALVAKAFMTLARSIRTKYAFKDKPENKAYIPKFYIVQEDWDPPEASEKLERGLVQIKKYLYSQVNLLPNLAPRRNPSLQDLKQFLIEKKYLVKITDKNLGLSVVSLEWYTTQCRIHLSNSIAYKESEIGIQSLLRELQEISTLAHTPSAIRRYIQASTMQLPKFYVIPKVHKTPWSSRPIVPSHSWITSRVAEVVDYALQPLIPLFPSILTSSKEVKKKLQKVKSFENCWIVTGDVVAMYTNIEPFAAINSIRTILQRENKGIRKSNLVRMIEFVLLNNFFKYEEKTYYQTTGLAMGVACAPVIANLFCAIHEREHLKYRSKVQFYGRFIDDLLVIFKGTESELLNWLDTWKLPGLDIKWEYSKEQAVFLDIELQIKNDELVTRVYNKVLNKYMYIPFSSAHPLSVKRAFVKAERTRYKTLCSLEQDYKACESKLLNNLLRRGYPRKVLGEWFKDSLQTIERPIPKLVLKSQYNPIWEYIRIGPIKDILQEYQEDDLELDSLVTSLKKGKSLYDTLNFYNITLLNTLELEGEI